MVNDFYLAVFEMDMSALSYGTYFGGSLSEEHVDGGTSRFDRRGRVYEAVCAGCGSNDDFPHHARCLVLHEQQSELQPGRVQVRLQCAPGDRRSGGAVHTLHRRHRAIPEPERPRRHLPLGLR